MLLLKQNTIKKRQIDENKIKCNNGNVSGKYKLKAIYKSMVYIRKLADYPLSLYYLIFCKSFLEKKNI